MSLPTQQGKQVVEAHASFFSAEEKQLVDLLVSLDQAHLFASWPAVGQKDDDKRRFLQQVANVEKDYLGGIKQYVSRAKQLLAFAGEGGNPYEGFSVSEPTDSVRLEEQKDFFLYEKKGLEASAGAAFVIVAGGLGERLGYKGIKLALPSESVSGKPFVQLYIESILALQARARQLSGDEKLLLPLAIMTSDDTDVLTRELLDGHENFGMAKEQLTVFKQGKVPSLQDSEAHFVLDEKDPFLLDTKPHGHGDVHMLLFKQGIVEKWVKQQGKKHVVFFQDTNGLVFHAIPAALGVSVAKQLEVNSITVPRVQGDAVGAICRLFREKKPVGSGGEDLPNRLTINVEYNQLEGLLGKGVKEPLVPGTNYSIYPGNINVLVFDAVKYLSCLEEKKGEISEFVNPKYKEDKKSFKKPTRLECMMQDYPKLLKEDAAVGFTQFQRWTAFSAVKNAVADGVAKQKGGNAAEVAATGEADLFFWPYKILKDAGVQVGELKDQVFSGVTVQLGPKIVLAPSFAVTQEEVVSRFPSPSLVSIASAENTALVLEGNITVKALQLKQGALIIQAVPGAEVVVDGLVVDNRGWKYEQISQEEEALLDQKWLVRGFTVKREQADLYVFDRPGKYVLPEAKASSPPLL